MKAASRNQIANALKCFRKHFWRVPKNAFEPDSRRIKNELCAEFGIEKTTMYKLCGRTNFWKIKGTRSRKCPQCKQVKRLTEYPKQGFGWCRSCKSKLATEMKRDRRMQDPSYALSVKSYHAAYHLKKYRVDANHMHKLKGNNAKRRARMRGARIEKTDPSLVYGAKNCYWCGTRLMCDGSLDHVVPISRGGAHASFNIVACCLQCNWEKNAKMPDQWTPSGQLELILKHD